MTIHDQIRAAFSNVGRRKLRSALASLGVVVGTVTIVLMVTHDPEIAARADRNIHLRDGNIQRIETMRKAEAAA